MLNNSNISNHNILRRHTSYVNTDEMQTCFLPPEIGSSYEVACSFVNNTRTCYDMSNRINYLVVMSCYGKINADLAGLIEMGISFLIILLIATTYLFLVTKYFILPNLIHVCTYMHMPLYDFGVATIAVIISGPQIAWIFHDCESVTKSSTLMLANMMGRTFTTFTVGLSVACFGQHTKLPGADIVKHIFLAMIILTFNYTMVHSRFGSDYVQGQSEFVTDLRPIAFFLVIIYVSNLAYTIMTKRRRSRHSSMHSRFHHHIAVAETNNGWTQLWHALNPLEHVNMPKYLIIPLTPIWVLAALQIPVIDKSRHMFGWCKYLTCLNIFFFPWVMWYAAGVESKMLLGIAFFNCMIVLLITILFTRVTEAPRYQGFYAVAGILFGFWSYYVIQEELETILWQSFSFLFNMPRDIIMLSGYVFHNVLNLVIFCYELVSIGHGNLACGVVMGVVLNQIFLMLPIITFHMCLHKQSTIAVSANSSTCYVFLILAFLLTLLSLCTTNFKLRISQGVYLIMLYVIFLMFVILSGMLVIHPYGGVHSVSAGITREAATWA